MTPDTAWRRGLFEPAIVHAQDPHSEIHTGPRVGRWARSVCDRRVLVHTREGPDTMRCPDCVSLVDGDLPAGGGSPPGPRAAGR